MTRSTLCSTLPSVATKRTRMRSPSVRVKVSSLDLGTPEAARVFAVRLRPEDAAKLARVAKAHKLGPHALARRVLEAFLREQS